MRKEAESLQKRKESEGQSWETQIDKKQAEISRLESDLASKLRVIDVLRDKVALLEQDLTKERHNLRNAEIKGY